MFAIHTIRTGSWTRPSWRRDGVREGTGTPGRTTALEGQGAASPYAAPWALRGRALPYASPTSYTSLRMGRGLSSMATSERGRSAAHSMP